MYYLAIFYNDSGWSLECHETLEEIKELIKTGQTNACPFKILKEIEFQLIDDQKQLNPKFIKCNICGSYIYKTEKIARDDDAEFVHLSCLNRLENEQEDKMGTVDDI